MPTWEMGRLGGDPELKTTSSGKSVCNFSLAVDRGFGDNKKTEWYTVVAWEKQAESAARFLRKGYRLIVEGNMTTRSWETKDGERRYRTELVAYRLTFIDFPPKEETQKQTSNRAVPDYDDDDIPF